MLMVDWWDLKLVAYSDCDLAMTKESKMDLKLAIVKVRYLDYDLVMMMVD